MPPTIRQQRRDTMSQIVRGFLGAGVLSALAITGSVGAAQLALGGDLEALLASSRATMAPVSSAQDVNRAAKADRALLPQIRSGQTFGVNLVGQSVLVRVPADHLGDATRVTRDIKPAAPAKRIVACEPVVSVLTEVAKSLQPGRCVA